MDEQTEKKSGTFRLLQPELMSDGELSDIMKSLCVVRDLRPLSRPQLIQLFRKVALPLPQRVYPSTWRGKLLTSRRHKYEKKNARKRKISMESGNSNGLTLLSKERGGGKDKPSRTKSPSRERAKSPPKDRLKPPVDLINYQRKTIKLSSSSSKSGSDLDKIIIKDRRRSEDSSDLDRIVIKDKRKESSGSESSPSKRIVISKSSSSSSELDRIVIKDRRKEKEERVSGGDGGSKKIKLSSNKSSGSSDLDKIVINDRRKSKSEDSAKTSRAERLSSSESGRKTEEGKTEKQKKIKLKRAPLTQSVSETESVTPAKKNCD